MGFEEQLRDTLNQFIELGMIAILKDAWESDEHESMEAYITACDIYTGDQDTFMALFTIGDIGTTLVTRHDVDVNKLKHILKNKTGIDVL